MPTVHQSLLALQAADDELDACRRRIRALRAELADEGPIAAMRAAVETAQADLAGAQKAIGDGEQALDSVNRTIAKLEKRLFDGSIHNAREAESVEEELGHRRAQRGAAEDAVLAAMERAEAAQAAITAAQARLAEAERARAERLPALKAEGRDATARVKVLEERRGALAAAAPQRLLTTYEHLRAAHAPAVATVNGGACGACGVAVPSAMRQRIAADEPLACLNCTRLLVEG